MKSSLIIDGNYLLNKDVFILFEMKTLYSDLPVLLRKDVDKLTRMYSYDSIYFVSDSKYRWRQDIYRDYKGNRKKHENIDWEWVNEEYNKLKGELTARPNIHFYEVPNTEGDDLIAHIVKKNNKKGISCVIMGSDADLHQLIRFDLGLGYMNIMHNYKFSDERTFFPKNHRIFLTEMSKQNTNSLFDMGDEGDFLEFLTKLRNRTKVTEVSDEQSLFCKIVTGDRGDNIPSVHLKMTKGGTRGIGKSGGNTLYKLYKEINKEDIDFYHDSFIEKVTEVVSYSRKVVDESEKHSIRNSVIRNRQLVMLDEKFLPRDIQMKIESQVRV
jgi:5'-3' exonuclease